MTSESSRFDKSNSELCIEHPFDDETPPSVAIIQAIAIIENTQPMNLPDECEFTLYDHIDPEALDRLVTANTRNDVTIDLYIQSEHEYVVQVRDTRQLVVQKDT
jgi:Halobacterial output domain 1